MVSCDGGTIFLVKYTKEDEYDDAVLLFEEYTDVSFDVKDEERFFNFPLNWGKIKRSSCPNNGCSLCGTCAMVGFVFT